MRHSPLMKAFSMRLIMFPCMFVFMKTAQMGAQTAIYLASDEKVKNTSGAFFKWVFKDELLFPVIIFFLIVLQARDKYKNKREFSLWKIN